MSLIGIVPSLHLAITKRRLLEQIKTELLFTSVWYKAIPKRGKLTIKGLIIFCFGANFWRATTIPLRYLDKFVSYIRLGIDLFQPQKGSIYDFLSETYEKSNKEKCRVYAWVYLSLAKTTTQKLNRKPVGNVIASSFDLININFRKFLKLRVFSG